MNIAAAALLAFAAVSTPALAAGAGAPVDQAFVAKVSQGGMFEVEASKVAEKAAEAQDVKDFAAAEVHDHTLVGAHLKRVANGAGITFSSKLNGEFQGKLDTLKGLSGHAFDVAYMDAMADIHAKDGAAFAEEAKASASPDFKRFAAETHVIVLRHIGAIHAAPPPLKG